MDYQKGATFDGFGRLACIGQNLHKVPTVLSKMYSTSVKCLDLSNNAIISLQGLDDFIGVQEVILDNNQLTDSLTIPYMYELQTLSLNKNKINDLESFVQKVASSLPSLKYLSLLGNPACPDQLSNRNHDEHDYKLYRYYVVNHLPQLNFLDFLPVSSDEQSIAKQRGHLMRLAKPHEKIVDQYSTSPGSADLTPLPGTQRQIDDHQGAFGKCRYRYSGKNSEGNRFIQNNDL